MNTLEKIIHLLANQNKKQKDLTDYLGVTKNTFTNWKLGVSYSYKKHIDKIAEFLGVSTDYLLGVETEQKNPLPGANEERIKEIYNMTSDLTDEEIIALKAFVAGMKSTRKPD